MQGVPEQFIDEKDSARFRHLAQVPGVELYHAHISRYAFEPHTHEAFGIGAIEAGAERFRYRGTQYVAPAQSVVTMNPDELHTGEADTADGWRYRMIYLEPDLLEEVTGIRRVVVSGRYAPRSVTIAPDLFADPGTLARGRSAGAKRSAALSYRHVPAIGASCADAARRRTPF